MKVRVQFTRKIKDFCNEGDRGVVIMIENESRSFMGGLEETVRCIAVNKVKMQWVTSEDFTIIEVL